MRTAAAQTAVGPIVIAAIDQYNNHPLVIAPLAHRMLPGIGRLAVAAAAWAPVHRSIIAVTERKIPGLWASMLCRKRHIDDKLRVACKRARLTRIYGAPPENVRLVPLDFETENLREILAQHGYRGTGRTFFVWEAVTQYLTEVAVRNALEFMASAPSGSDLVFTYIRKDFLDGTALYGGEVAYRQFVVNQRLWHFGLMPEQVAPFLAVYGWDESEQMGQLEFTDHYLHAGQRNMPVSDIERSVHAVRT